MLRLGVLALLLAAGSVFVAAQGHSAARASIEHTCGLTDRQFIENYEVQIESVGMYGNDYLSGNAKASDLISAAQDAARIVHSSAPFDPSLQLVKRLAPGMFYAYAEAVRTRDRGGNPNKEMYTAFVVGERVHDVLREAQPGLTAAGCDISNML